MNRRIWIKQVVLAGGAVLCLPSCAGSDDAVSVTLKNISITGKEEALLSELTEAIIPETDTLGAKSLNLHQFVLKMFDDCYSDKEQEMLLSGLRQLNKHAQKKTDNLFSDLSRVQQSSLLSKASASKNTNQDLLYFLNETRAWTVKGYRSSEYVLTKLLPYKLVPGHFHGCVEINRIA